MSLLKKLFNHKSPEESQREWLIKHGAIIGKNVTCFSWNGVDSNYPGLIKIGDNTLISSNVRVLAHDASIGRRLHATKIGIVDIGQNCFIGANSVILPNVRIGDWCIIGAGSVVTKDTPPHSVYAGNPAKFVMTIEEYYKKHEIGIETKPVSYKPWNEWANATDEEWEKLRNELSHSIGYVVKKNHNE